MKPIRPEQRASFQSGALPAPTEVGPGVHAVAIPFRDPFVPFTYCYLIEDGREDLIVIDPGADHPDAREALLDGLSVIGRRLSSITIIAVTHQHVDHVGAVAWLSSETAAPAFSHPLESRHGEVPTAALLDRWGVPPTERGAFSHRRHLPTASDALRRLRPLEDGPMGVTARVLPLWTPGHTPGHTCFAVPDAKVLLTGDHVLPITRPAIASAWPIDADLPRSAVTAYLDSLEALERYAEFAVLPGHEYAFAGLSDRIQELRDHQERRSRAIRSIVGDRTDLSTWEVASRVDWTAGWANLDANHRRLALSQTEAHLLRIRS